MAVAFAASSICQAQTTAVREEKVLPAPAPVAAPAAGMQGTLRSVNTDSFVLQGDEKAAPLTFRDAQSTQYVDESGKVVKRELLVPGVPVTVESIRTGEGVLASRVIVHQRVAKTTEQGPAGTTTTTTTTTTRDAVKATTAEGVMGLWEKDRFQLNTPKDGAVTFLYSKDTKIVDADNKPVEVIRMRQPGLPVTVKFEQEGDRLMANQITVNLRFVEVSR